MKNNFSQTELILDEGDLPAVMAAGLQKMMEFWIKGGGWWAVGTWHSLVISLLHLALDMRCAFFPPFLFLSF